MNTHIQRTLRCFVFIETAIQISTVIGKRISFKCIQIMRERERERKRERERERERERFH